MNPVLLRAENLVFGYDRRQPVLRGISCELRAGEVTAVFGPNGCGKSTFLRCLNGALRPQSGSVRLGDTDLADLSYQAVARRIAVVPQDTPPDVPLTAFQMAMLGRHAHSVGGWGEESAADREIVRAAMAQTGVAELAARPFAQLSGGERQRVVIARALAQQGDVLLMDEPSTHLDIAHQLELYRLARRQAADGKAVLMVCHDLFLAPRYADSALLLAVGTVMASGKVTEVLSSANIQTVFGCKLPWEVEELVIDTLLWFSRR